MARRRDHALADKLVPIVGVERLQEARQVARAEVGVHLRDTSLEIILITLGQAARDEQFVELALLLGRRVVEDRVNRLLLRVVDKSAGVDHDDRGIIAVGLMLDLELAGEQPAHQHLGIIEILRTAESDDLDLVLFEGFRAHREEAASVWDIVPDPSLSAGERPKSPERE